MKKLMIWVVVLVVVLVGFFVFNNSPSFSPKSSSSPTNKFSYPLELPDLAVNVSLVSVTNITINGSNQFFINYTTDHKNVGNDVASNVLITSVDVVLCNNGSVYRSKLVNLTMPVLAPNQIFSKNYGVMVSCSGLWIATATIDPYNLVQELDENNNFDMIYISL